MTISNFEIKALNSLKLVTSIKTALICEGKNHLYLNFSKRLGIRDLAPCAILLQEAGGYANDISSSPFEYTNEEKVKQLVVLSALKFIDEIVL